MVSTVETVWILAVRFPSTSSVAVAPVSVYVSPTVRLTSVPLRVMIGLVVSVGITGLTVTVLVTVSATFPEESFTS